MKQSLESPQFRISLVAYAVDAMNVRANVVAVMEIIRLDIDNLGRGKGSVKY